MRRITLWALSTLTTLVLLFSYHTSTAGPGATLAAGTSVQAPAAAGSGTGSGSADTSADDSAGNTGTGSGSSTGGTGTGSGSPSSGSASTSGSQTFDGDTVQTRWGPVQVRITVTDAKITASEAIVYPNGNHEDAQINAVALPVLNDEAVQQQSADLDMVSGATVTSQGYLSSLQSAIDRAHL